MSPVAPIFSKVLRMKLNKTYMKLLDFAIVLTSLGVDEKVGNHRTSLRPLYRISGLYIISLH
jgi:hypothetical protein